MGVLAEVASTTTSTTQTPVCQVFANGAAQGNCQALYNYFAPPAWYTQMWIGLLGAVVVLGAFVAIRVYYEFPFGRFFWKKKGIKAIMHFYGAPGMLGMLYPYLDKIFLFVSSGSERKKNRIVRLIPAVPGSITHLRQEDGGDSIALIQGNKGVPVSPELQEWAEKNLNELSDTHDWNHFALKVKADMLTRMIAEAKLFPIVRDWNPGTDTVYILQPDGQTMLPKKAIECTPEEKKWYIQASEQADAFLKTAGDQASMTLAILNGQDTYEKNGQRVPLPARAKTEWVGNITKELATMTGGIGSAFLGGAMVTVQYVANILSNTPDGVYFDGAKAEVEEKVRKEMGRKSNDIIKMAIAAVIIIGGVGIMALIIGKYG